MVDRRLPFEVLSVTDVTDEKFDAVVLVTNDIENVTGDVAILHPYIVNYLQVDELTDLHAAVIYCDKLPSKRLIYSPTGVLNRDYDDVRRFSDAANIGVKRALDCGCKRPLLVCLSSKHSFKHSELVSLIGAFHAIYVPIEIREEVPDKKRKVSLLGVFKYSQEIIKQASALEMGRSVARDIGGSDPERMAAIRVASYVEELFKGSSIKVEVKSGHDNFVKNYPLLAAVNRCAKDVPRHDGRIIFLEYTGEGNIEETVFLVGKGITYDTGGADIKAGGIMAGMHRDKCGSAAVAGFFQVLNDLKPKGIKVVGAMAMVRNSVGEDCYVADEIITSRAGIRVRIGNTDAEGRMAMTDVLCDMKERAANSVNPHLFTIATLTGHAVIAMGCHYSIIMDNGPAKQKKMAHSVQDLGEEIADPFEISTIRREDYTFNKGPSEYEDVLQCNNAASSRTQRGHQIPASFMIVASGLDKHGIDSEKPLPYSHIDIAGSSGPFPGIPTGAPILALSRKFILGRI